MELVLPNNYVELEQEEMMYLDGGEAYRGLGAWFQISRMLGTSFGWYVSVGKLAAAAAGSAATGIGSAYAVLAACGATGSLISALWNTAMVGAAVLYTMQDGGFSNQSTGFWVWSWEYVSRL